MWCSSKGAEPVLLPCTVSMRRVTDKDICFFLMPFNNPFCSWTGCLYKVPENWVQWGKHWVLDSLWGLQEEQDCTWTFAKSEDHLWNIHTER